jgi:hypothetical protein
MNLGLGNLDDLKQFILAESLRDQTDKDAVLQVIGKGVAAAFHRRCNRDFDRVVGAVDNFTADRSDWTLRRYPVEAITSVEIKSSDSEGYVAQTDAIQNSHLEAGLIDFGGFLGDHRTRVRVVYTGGFWFETKEPTDDDYPTAQPEGTTAVPDDLKQAWLLQCQHVFESKDHLLPKGIAADGSPLPLNLKDAGIVPAVEELLRGFIRYQIT